MIKDSLLPLSLAAPTRKARHVVQMCSKHDRLFAPSFSSSSSSSSLPPLFLASSLPPPSRTYMSDEALIATAAAAAALDLSPKGRSFPPPPLASREGPCSWPGPPPPPPPRRGSFGVPPPAPLPTTDRGCGRRPPPASSSLGCGIIAGRVVVGGVALAAAA
jgi:hypothetical protein